ncbi:hypothetical protein MITS9504_02182 [Synechococcus sp. MIT S9504]|nr:hypothetical protein MITS9504_02182 [Synechococcus sp. MIT S9504]
MGFLQHSRPIKKDPTASAERVRMMEIHILSRWVEHVNDTYGALNLKFVTRYT